VTHTTPAIHRDFWQYTQDYPQLRAALKEALRELVQHRPTDPLEFLAESLRKLNMQQKLETEEMLIASIRIQKRARGMEERKRVNAMRQELAEKKAATAIQSRERGIKERRAAQHKRQMLNVWLYELYLRMESKKTKNVASSDIASYIQSDPDIMENLGLDRRFVRLPAIFQASSRAFVDGFRANPSAFPRRVSWEPFATFFGVKATMAQAAVMDHSACKIQARHRGAFQRKKQESRQALA